MANNNQPQISSVTSETLQEKIRQLLPSQQGFGFDLMAQNVIVPIIDLTEAAENSVLRKDLQEALGLGVTHNQIAGGTTTIQNSTGFWRIFGNVTWRGSLTNEEARIEVTDGFSTTVNYELNILGSGSPTNDNKSASYDFIVFLAAGQSVVGVSSSAVLTLNVTSRQIADVSGNLTEPQGF